MIKGIIRFNRALFKMPKPLLTWLMLLMATNMIVPLFFLQQFEARVISLLIDIVDVIRYARGDRAETVQGL